MPLLYFRVPSTTLMCSIPHLMASVDSSKASLPSLYFLVPSTTLMSPIPHLMASVDSSKASFSVQQEHVEESGGGCVGSQEEVGESEEGV